MRVEQYEMVSLDNLVGEKHAYRKLKSLINFIKITKAVGMVSSPVGAIGYTSERLITCLILQFMEDLSDREFERFIAENTAGKWFCDFGLTEKTPNYSTICKFRGKLGEEGISKIFEAVREQLVAKGYMAEVFTFIDATALTSKLTMWEERDKAIQDGYEKFNNEVIEKYAKEKDVRIGAKGKNKFWFGFKKHVSADMQSGMINRVSVTKANVTDAQGAKGVLPDTGAVVADKGYVGAIPDIKEKGLHPMVILKNNMSQKNKDKDSWLSKLRSPYEGTFSKQNEASPQQDYGVSHTARFARTSRYAPRGGVFTPTSNKRVRYKGVSKNQAAEFLYAIAYNFRRLLVLETAPSRA